MWTRTVASSHLEVWHLDNPLQELASPPAQLLFPQITPTPTAIKPFKNPRLTTSNFPQIAFDIAPSGSILRAGSDDDTWNWKFWNPWILQSWSPWAQRLECDALQIESVNKRRSLLRAWKQLEFSFFSLYWEPLSVILFEASQS